MSRPIALLPLALAMACAHAPQPGPAAEVVELDARWAAAAAAGDGPRFRALVSADALFAGRSLLRGSEEVWGAWKAFFDEGGPRIRWAPAAGGAAGSGDLAWTTGRFRLERRDASGNPAASEGQYLTVWAREPGGWRVALDCPLEPAAGPAARAALRTLRSRDGTLEAAMGTWEGEGPEGRRSGAWLTVKERDGGEWRTRFDSAVVFPPR